MKSQARDSFLGTLATFCFLLTISLPAQEAQPPNESAAVPAKQEAKETVPEKAAAAQVNAAEESQPAAKTSEKSPQPATPTRVDVYFQTGSLLGGHVVPENTRQFVDAVSILGDTTVDGELLNKAVSIFGDTIVNGQVRGEAVSIFGDLEINGHLAGKAVVLFGDLRLGEKAVVDKGAVIVMGNLERHTNAVVQGQVRQSMSRAIIPHLKVWTTQCLRFGRLLGFGSGLGWIWLVAAIHLVFYLLLALVFRHGVVKCVKTFEQSPGHSIVSAFFALILAPLVVVLLALTGIGMLVIPLLLVGLLLVGCFGRAVMHAVLGRLLTRHLGDSRFAHVAFSVVVGGVIISLLYCIPVLGLCLHGLIGALGLGVVCYTLLLHMRKEVPTGASHSTATTTPAPSSSPVTSAIGAVVPALGVAQGGSPSAAAVLGGLMIHSAAPAPTPTLQPISDSDQPRAGFWIRMAASGIDITLCCILAAVLGLLLHAVPSLRIGTGIGFRGFFLLLAIYGTVMWKLRGATIGGIVFNLKVVRLDDEPIDWMTAVIRALSCFLSLVVAGLGFFWIAIDTNHQSWHDKIAGTVVIRMTKGVSLV